MFDAGTRGPAGLRDIARPGQIAKLLHHTVAFVRVGDACLAVKQPHRAECVSDATGDRRTPIAARCIRKSCPIDQNAAKLPAGALGISARSKYAETRKIIFGLLTMRGVSRRGAM